MSVRLIERSSAEGGATGSGCLLYELAVLVLGGGGMALGIGTSAVRS
jgi:hypothetical protein